MKSPIIIPGTFTRGTFTPDGPLPDAEGRAELIVIPNDSKDGATPSAGGHSAFEVFGNAPVLRTREEIDAQIREERESWGDR